jgi:hypothetical protein
LTEQAEGKIQLLGMPLMVREAVAKRI